MENGHSPSSDLYEVEVPYRQGTHQEDTYLDLSLDSLPSVIDLYHDSPPLLAPNRLVHQTYTPILLPPHDTPQAESPWRPSLPDRFAGTFLDDRLRFLRECLEQIGSQIEARQDMNKAFLKEIESEITDLEFQLNQIRNTRIGTSLTIDTPRVHLIRETGLLRRQKRESSASCWRDLAWLTREFRRLLAEYRSLVRIRGLVS